jgi:hypothetical protein
LMNVISDLSGATGLAIVRALLQGDAIPCGWQRSVIPVSKQAPSK